MSGPRGGDDDRELERRGTIGDGEETADPSLFRRTLLRGTAAGVSLTGGASAVRGAVETAEETYPNEIVISGRDSPGEATYEFQTSRGVEAMENPAGDSTDGTTAWGAVTTWMDGYRFEGEIVYFRYDGPIRVFVDGTEVAPSALGEETRVLRVDGREYAAEAAYEFTVSGRVFALSTGDNADGTRAWGRVSTWYDEYEFLGELTGFHHDGDLDLYVDGDALDPDAVGADVSLDGNSRDEFRDRGTTLTDFENGLGGWSATGGTLSHDTTRAFDGEGSARVSGSDGFIGMRRRFDGLDLSERDVSIAATLTQPEDPLASRTMRTRLFAPDRNNSLRMVRCIESDHGWVRLDFGPADAVGDPDLTNVREIRIDSWTGGEFRSFNVDAIRTTPKLDRGKVILTFDDNHLSQYTAAYPVMRQYDFPGVCAPNPRWVGIEGRMSLAQMHDLRDAGWEMVAHPHYPHGEDEEPFYAFSPDHQRRIFESDKRWFIENGFEQGVVNFIWPKGEFDEELMNIATDYHRLCLGQRHGSVGGVVTDPGFVARVKGDRVDETKRAIEMAERYRTVTVVMYHMIGKTESRISTAEFEETMAFLADRDVDVITASRFAEIQERF